MTSTVGWLNGALGKSTLFIYFQISITFGGAVVGPMLGVYLSGGISRLANWKVISIATASVKY